MHVSTCAYTHTNVHMHACMHTHMCIHTHMHSPVGNLLYCNTLNLYRARMPISLNETGPCTVREGLHKDSSMHILELVILLKRLQDSLLSTSVLSAYWCKHSPLHAFIPKCSCCILCNYNQPICSIYTCNSDYLTV